MKKTIKRLQPEYETIPHIIDDQFAHDDNITITKEYDRVYISFYCIS